MKRPNVMLFCFDHFPGPLMGAAGHETIMTPTLDHLCACGLRFSQAYSATPTCIPARRALMTGTTAKTHGDRIFNATLPMNPRLPTLAQTFRNAGYQAYAVGKLHVHPQRDRIGFDDVLLNEEGRHQFGQFKDDFELFLEREGYAGQELTHAMGNNVYTMRPWHLPESCHPTNWTVREMCRTILRRDPTRPAFWYCSFIGPHPPITPPRDYLAMYREEDLPEPFIGDWAQEVERMPYALRKRRDAWGALSPRELRLALRGFYAQCTYIDHQMRLVLGTLREEGLLENTVIMVTGDHGDMLGNHNLLAKPPMQEYSAKIPMILVPHQNGRRTAGGTVDDRLVELRDVMPTLLDLCGIPVPETVEGLSLVSDEKREHLYGEHYEDAMAVRMLRSGPYKLIWYPAGNRFQLFNLDRDPRELHDLSQEPAHAETRERLTELLRGELYGADEQWIHDGELVGMPEPEWVSQRDAGMLGQRGWR